jgi:hypothetical protein
MAVEVAVQCTVRCRACHFSLHHLRLCRISDILNNGGSAAFTRLVIVRGPAWTEVRICTQKR